MAAEVLPLYSPEQVEASENAQAAATFFSLARAPLGALCAAATIREWPPSVATGLNAVNEATDPVDGLLAKKYGFACETGDVNTLSGVARGAVDWLFGEQTGKEFLLSINGPWVDERFDKISQNLRRFALLFKGRVGVVNGVGPLLRDELVSNARELYGSYNVAGVESAKRPGQLKTVLMGGTFIVGAAIGRKHPRVRQAAFTASTAAAVATGLHYVYSFEKALQEELGNDTSETSALSILTGGLERVTRYTVEKRQRQLNGLADRVGLTSVWGGTSEAPLSANEPAGAQILDLAAHRLAARQTLN